MHRRISLPIAVAAVVCLAIAVPTASAATKTDKAQTKALKKQAKAIKKNSANIRKGANAVKKLDSSTAAAGNAIKSLKEIADRADANAKTVLDAAPAIIKGLTDLKTGLEAAGAGLVSLRTLATSQEYGFGQLVVISAGPTPNPQLGSFVVTPDMPDTVQQAQTTQQFVAQHTGNLAVAYGIRSNESDGTGAQNPAGACKVTVTNEGGTTETTAPNATLGNVPFQFVPTKSSLTSTIAGNEGFPFGLKQNGADADNTTTFASSVAVTAGDTYTVGLSCVDTSPSATDPSA